MDVIDHPPSAAAVLLYMSKRSTHQSTTITTIAWIAPRITIAPEIVATTSLRCRIHSLYAERPSRNPRTTITPRAAFSALSIGRSCQGRTGDNEWKETGIDGGVCALSNRDSSSTRSQRPDVRYHDGRIGFGDSKGLGDPRCWLVVHLQHSHGLFRLQRQRELDLDFA
mmetsp:Transcript_20056/g.55805  ORF Transcript_20056/g.55805 Transcript_20056/m.55805 type:complete len:168 (-) Transcript_20056:197-700(-)